MEKLAKAISNWLAGQVKNNPKLNPVPPQIFEALLNKQIEAAKKRGQNIDYNTLAEAVKIELSKSNIAVIPSSSNMLQKSEETHPELAASPEREAEDEDANVFNAGANIGVVIGSTVRNVSSAAVDAGMIAGKAAVDAGVVVGKAAVNAGTTVGKAAVSVVKKAGILTAGIVSGTLLGAFKAKGKDKDKKA